MKTFLMAALCLLGTVTSQAQTPPDTFSAGIPSENFTRFFIGDGYQKPKVAIRLPEEMAGQLILGIRSWYSQDRDGVTPEKWADKAVFTWTLNAGSVDQPGSVSSELVKVPLSSDSSLRNGNWGVTAVEWPVLEGATYWLVGHWHDTASFVRLGSNYLNLAAPITVGYKNGPDDEWQPYTAGGIMVEVAYGTPNQGIPSGIFDPEDQSSTGRGERPISARIAGGSLRVSLDRPNRSYSSYNLLVVNALGQTIVQASGTADFGEVRIPWSATRPSGVYFCRIQVGGMSYSVPVVNLK